MLAKNDDAGADPIRIAVTAQQFAWKFEYPVTRAHLRPARAARERAGQADLRSLDVIHSFWVPEFGQKSDAVPGIETTLVITPNRTGEFSIVCTELCGLGHALMRASVRVVEREEYETFLAGAPATGGDDASGESVFTTRLRRLPRVRAGGGRRPGRPSLLNAIDPGGQPLEDFIREAIVDPNARIAAGIRQVMPETYESSLSDEQLDALVQYLVEGQQ